MGFGIRYDSFPLIPFLLLLAVSQGPPAVPVRVAPVEEREVNRLVELVGSGLPRRRSVVAAQVEGPVVKVLFEEGAEVKAGAPLAELDARELELSVKAAAAAKAEIEARHRRAGERLKRSKGLFDKGRISEEEYKDDLHSEAALKEEGLRAGANLDRLKTRLGKAVVRAPFDGIVLAKRTEVGEWVRAGDPVAVVLDLSSIHVRLDLPERYLPRLRRKETVEVRADSLPAKTFSGRIFSILPEADLEARTVPIKVEVANAKGMLIAGMFFRVSLQLDEKKKALLVPKDAVVIRGALAHVFVVEKGTARQVRVTPGAGYGPDLEIVGPLKPGQQVVVRGNERLFPGSKVAIEGDR